MVKGKAKAKKRRSWQFKRKRRRGNRRIPLSVAIPVGLSAVVAGKEGYGSPLDCVGHGDFIGAVDSIVCGWLPGIDMYRGQIRGFDIQGLNPMNMYTGRNWKTLFWSVIGVKVAGMLGIKAKVDDMFARVPILRKFKL